MTARLPHVELHKAQKIAALLLTIFCLQALWTVARLPLDMRELRTVLAGEALWSHRALGGSHFPLLPGDSVLEARCAGLLPSIAKHWDTHSYSFSIYAAPNRWLVRLPFVAFAVWLGGALWWVCRRTFGDEGGYVALAMYCFSPPVIIAGSTVNAGILSAWGLFGLVYTAIGVAHTLYAPARRWRPRILLLGTAFGLTAAASVTAAVCGVIVAVIFMLYLAPGRRVVSVLILLVAGIIGATILLAFYAFRIRDFLAVNALSARQLLSVTNSRLQSLLAVPGGLLIAAVFVAALLVFVCWPRTRYFGNTAPLLTAAVLMFAPGRFAPGTSAMWSLPFALAFIGGIYADLLEPRFFAGAFRRHVIATAGVVIAATALLSAALLTSL